MMEGLCFYFFQIPGNKGVLNFMHDPKLAHILVLIEALIELRKMLLRKKLYHVPYGLEIAQPLTSPDSADLQRCN